MDSILSCSININVTKIRREIKDFFFIPETNFLLNLLRRLHYILDVHKNLVFFIDKLKNN